MKGIDVPEVSLVAILMLTRKASFVTNADLSRPLDAARNSKAVMWWHTVTQSMQRKKYENGCRRKIQMAYNEEHGIVPQTIKKELWSDCCDQSSVKEEDKEATSTASSNKSFISIRNQNKQEAVEVLDLN